MNQKYKMIMHLRRHGVAELNTIYQRIQKGSSWTDNY